MNLRHLTIFKTVCETGSITGAARQLSMTQPAISHAVTELEEEAGSPLFDRASRKVILNDNGKLYLSKVIPLLELYADLERTNGNLHRNAPLRIGSCVTLATYLLPSTAVRFSQSNPETALQVKVANSQTIEQMLLNNEIDIGLIEGVITSDQLEKIPFSSYPLAAVCAPDHPLAAVADQPVSLDDLVKEPLLLRESGCTIRDSFDSLLTLRNLSCEPAWVSANSDALLAAARDGLGICIIPRISADEAIRRGEAAEIEVAGMDLSCMNHVVFGQDKFQTEAFQAFINLVLFD